MPYVFDVIINNNHEYSICDFSMQFQVPYKFIASSNHCWALFVKWMSRMHDL